MAIKEKLTKHLEMEEIKARYLECSDPVEKIHWLLIS